MEVLSRRGNLNQVIRWLSTREARYIAYKDVVEHKKKRHLVGLNDVTKVKNYNNYNLVFNKSQEGGINDVTKAKNSTFNG